MLRSENLAVKQQLAAINANQQACTAELNALKTENTQLKEEIAKEQAMWVVLPLSDILTLAANPPVNTVGVKLSWKDLLTLTLPTSITESQSATGQSCKSNADCGQDYLCIAGFCVPASIISKLQI